ncbi:tRNA uridine(34) 5-carboxymethylaminomethyl modification radical SAM/GNAT enzyme Elp3, partial [Candidatus Pacearchaeota archaeon]|nr:tRNA uridine(34) 5-carboxymethylaminomethyl modification radical SAM/GNAT enzyme Elp3 [Candidatus Pacearchaeota archaeon]
QSIFDPILKLNKRGHNVKQTIEATKLLKQAGFKITYHLMPNLPGSTPAKDLKTFSEIFSKPDFQPDQLKIYPCVVTKGTLLHRWYKLGKYKPYSDKQLKELLIKIKQIIPPYVRIARLIRDIPAQSIIGGNIITNLRQLIAHEIVNTKLACKCIRCREARDKPASLKNIKLFIKKYKASEGTEYFLSFESKDKKTLYAFLRLRINDNLADNFIDELKGAAIIRELHTYGELVPIGQRKKAAQHLGLGKKLMIEAENICDTLSLSKGDKIDKIAVISGIGVKQYYKKLGYKPGGTYMIKKF